MNLITPFGKSLAGGGAAFPADAPGYLFNDGGGNLSWDAAATPEAAGDDKQIQFNDVGTMGANAGLTFDKALGLLTSSNLDVTGTISISGSDNQVLFNDAGVIGGSNNFTYDSTAEKLTLSWSGVTGFMENHKNFVINATRTGGGGEGDPEEGDGYDSITGLEISTSALCTDTSQTGLKINSSMVDLPLSVTGNNNNRISASEINCNAINTIGASIHGLGVGCLIRDCEPYEEIFGGAATGIFCSMTAENSVGAGCTGMYIEVSIRDCPGSGQTGIRQNLQSYALTKNCPGELTGNYVSFDLAAADSFSSTIGNAIGFKTGGNIFTAPLETEHDGTISITELVGFKADFGDIYTIVDGTISISKMKMFSSQGAGDTVLYAIGGSITVGSYYGVEIWAPLAMAEEGATVSITNAYGLYIDMSIIKDYTTNLYGIYIKDVLSASGYNLYSAGATALNFLEGKIWIGETYAQHIANLVNDGRPLLSIAHGEWSGSGHDNNVDGIFIDMSSTEAGDSFDGSAISGLSVCVTGRHSDWAAANYITAGIKDVVDSGSGGCGVLNSINGLYGATAGNTCDINWSATSLDVQTLFSTELGGTLTAVVPAYGINVSNILFYDGTITIPSLKGINVAAPTTLGGGSLNITDIYGIYIEDQGSFATNNYNFYSAGATSLNVFEGTIRSYNDVNDAKANIFEFRKQRQGPLGAGQIGDEIGVISFWSNNSTPTLVEYANLTAKIADETDNEECGLITYSAMISGGGYEGNLPMVYTKTDAGDLTDAFEGMIVINTNDNTLKMYAEGAWRQLASW